MQIHKLIKPSEMKKLYALEICAMLTLVFIFTSCSKKSDPVPLPTLKIGLVSDLGGFSDAGFNQALLYGFQAASRDFPISSEARESKFQEDIASNIGYFVTKGFDLIITAGFNAAEATINAANANPGIDFVIIDYSIANPPANLLCAVFDVDQASFQCGFLAAWWALKQSPADPVTGFVAGPEIPEIRQFAVSYSKGVTYFNTAYYKNVRTIGHYATSFSDSLQGVELADSLIGQNASVIFAFAGPTGNGALYKVKEAGKWAIGVDVDQFFTIPSVAPILLTSCMKALDVIIYNIIYSYYNYYYPGGTVIHGNLNNGGVGIAPFHYFDGMIPNSIKTALSDIATGIKSGTIYTGWPE
jgi:basic membrane protein A